MPKRELIDTSGMVIKWQGGPPEQDSGMRRTEFISHVVEDDYKKVVHTIWQVEYLADFWEEKKGTIEQDRRKSISSKWMCIGGPFNGQRKTTTDAGLDYLEYNQASRRSDEFRLILLYKGLLPGNELQTKV